MYVGPNAIIVTTVSLMCLLSPFLILKTVGSYEVNFKPETIKIKKWVREDYCIPL